MELLISKPEPEGKVCSESMGCMGYKEGACLFAIVFFCIVFFSCGTIPEENELVDCEDNASFTLFDAARPRPEIPGAPRESDVPMRSLRPRLGENRNTFEAIRDFHVTRLEWTYLDRGHDPVALNGDFIRRLNDMGVKYGGAASTRAYAGDEPREVWNVVNLDGELVYPTWKRTWDPPAPYGCANNPEFREGHLRWFKSYVDAGADIMQRDEPFQNRSAPRWGGCFCDDCMEGFNDWLDRNADGEILERLGVSDLEVFDYRDYLREREAPVGDEFHDWPGDELKEYFQQFQTATSLEFHRWWRSELNEYAGRHIPVSCNNGVYRRDEIEQVFDYWIGELHHSRANPEHIYDAVSRALEYGKIQNATMPLYHTEEVSPQWVLHTRQTLATMYAVGGHMQMPWDTYLPLPEAGRFFGDPADYADLSAFIHAMADYLDGYADAAAAGGDITDDRWPPEDAPVRPMGDSVYAFARVKPDSPDSPVVIHLTDWSDTPEPFWLSIRPGALFGDRPLNYRLFRPVPYERQAHARAFESGDYSGMAEETQLDEGHVTGLEIPALEPWGILVVEPAGSTGSGEGVWQPLLTVLEEEFYCPDRLRISMESPTEGARIRYTTDGSEPDREDKLYTDPVVIESSRQVRARAFLGDKKSRIASLDIRRRTPERGFSPPGMPLLFDGEHDGVIIDDENDDYRLTSYTYSMWLKFFEGPTGEWRQVFTKGSATPGPDQRGPSVFLRDDSMRFHFTHSTGQTRHGPDSGELPLEEWMHVAFITTGMDGEMKIFINGTLDASASVSGLIDDRQDPMLWIGKGPAHDGIKARISDFRVYDRPLSRDEIMDLYFQRELEQGLVGHWPLTDESGGYAEELVSGNHGRLIRPERVWELVF